MLEKKRVKTVNTEFLQKYYTYLFSPHVPIHAKNENFTFRRATKEDEDRILAFLNEEGKKKDFFPVIKSIQQFTNLKVTDFYLLMDKDEIVATGAIWNQMGYRQYIVTNYHGIIKVAKYFNPLLKKLGYMQLPPRDKMIDYRMLSFFISKNEKEAYTMAFLKDITQEIKNKNDLFIVGALENSQLNHLLKKLRNIHFDSQIYGVEFLFKNNKNVEVNQENLYLECGLL